jgi:S1-C subfamily serine protease
MLVDEKEVTAKEPSPDTSDLAKLTVPGLECPCAEIGTKPDIGSKVKAIGFPGSLKGEQRVTDEVSVMLIGRPNEILPFLPNPESYIYTDKSVLEPGDSGGGLFQKTWYGKWKLIGISSHFIVTNPFFPFPVTSGFAPVYK